MLGYNIHWCQNKLQTIKTDNAPQLNFIKRYIFSPRLL